MTVAALLKLARAVTKKPTAAAGTELAFAVLALLADDGRECGMPRPSIRTIGPGRFVTLPEGIEGDWGCDDARAFARAILVSADEVEAVAVS